MRMRKKKNGAKRLENLSALFVNTESTDTITSEAVFNNTLPLRLEIGCGKGDFVCGISVSEKDFNYIALERVADVIMSAVEKYAGQRDLGTLDVHGGWLANDGKLYDGEAWDIPEEMKGNVRFVCGEAKEVLAKIPDSSVESIYTNFSDPWPKKGYVSRRLTHSSFLEEYARILVPGGMLKLKTDNEDFFDYSLESVSESKLKLVSYTRDLDATPEFAEGNVETEYERNFKSKGVKIKALRAVIEK